MGGDWASGAPQKLFPRTSQRPPGCPLPRVGGSSGRNLAPLAGANRTPCTQRNAKNQSDGARADEERRKKLPQEKVRRCSWRKKARTVLMRTTSYRPAIPLFSECLRESRNWRASKRERPSTKGSKTPEAARCTRPQNRRKQIPPRESWIAASR